MSGAGRRNHLPNIHHGLNGVTGWQYNGYFVSPLQGTQPKSGSAVRYPGGAVGVTSNSGSGGIVWAIANVEVADPCPPYCSGTLFAFDAGTLQRIWCTNSQPYCDNSAVFQPANFARPTIVNGNIYIPTYWQISKAGNSDCTAAEPCSGVIVYLHTQ